MRLPSDPLTGYRWDIIQGAPAILQSLGPETHTPSGDTAMVGATGTSIWRYRVTQRGQDELLMVYRRPWERESSVQQFKCRLKAQ